MRLLRIECVLSMCSLYVESVLDQPCPFPLLGLYIECVYIEFVYIECVYIECVYIECVYIECVYIECVLCVYPECTRNM